MRRFPRPIYLGISVVLLLTSGCATKAGWQYVPNPGRPAGVQVPLVVAVERFQDERGSSNSRYFWLCIIPLVPYCSSSYSQPENANGFLTEAAYNFRPSDDLAEATTIELRQTGMFKEVFVTNRISDPTAQLTVRGTIESTQWDGSEYSYLLGPYGSLLWIFGLPIGSAENNLRIKLELVERATGQQLWSTDINQDYSTTEGIYYNYATDFAYPQMYRTGMEAAVASLEAYVAQQPAAFWQRIASESGVLLPNK
jgi:hypothetical protein